MDKYDHLDICPEKHNKTINKQLRYLFMNFQLIRSIFSDFLQKLICSDSTSCR